LKQAAFIVALSVVLSAFMLWATTGRAQDPALPCICVTYVPSETPYPTLTPRATSTTISLVPSATFTPTPTRTMNNIFHTATALASIYQDATAFAAAKTLDANYNASTALAQTLYAYYTAQPSATPENAVTQTSTQQVTTYLVVELGGMNTRERPDRTSADIGDLYYGDRVSIGQTTQAGGYLWGLTSKGWVAINQDNGRVFLEVAR